MFRDPVGSSRFTTVVVIKRTGDKRGFAPAEWIWSDLFYWKNYDLAHERCMYWYESEPSPKTWTGKENALPHETCAKPAELSKASKR